MTGVVAAGHAVQRALAPSARPSREQLRTVQRAAGNAATTQWLARASAEDTGRPVARRTSVRDVLSTPGAPFAGPMRSEMEARYDADLGHLRVHTDPAAERSAHEIGAVAYTSRNHMVLTRAAARDAHVVAHEIAHTFDQAEGRVPGVAQPDGTWMSTPRDAGEQRAEARAAEVMSQSLPVGRAPGRPAGTSRRIAGDTTRVQRMGALTDQLKAAGSIFGLRADRETEGAPRQQAVKHIRTVLEESGQEDQDTVGNRIADTIEGIRTVAGERGSREIDTVFKNAALTPLFRLRSDDPRAEEAHETIARRELAYWSAEHSAEPTRGTAVAVGVDVPTRVRMQKNVGATTAFMRQFQEAFRTDMGGA